MVEIEIKIRVKDIEKVREKLEGFDVILVKDRYLEENTLYDFSSQSLLKHQQALRLRTANKKIFLAFKGTPQKSRKFKIRDEYETEVKNAKQIKKILQSLGLTISFSYKKHRSVYKKNHVKICLDETSVGNFLELEGKRNDIVKLARQLGFSKNEFIKLDYIQLMKKDKKSS